MKKNIVTASTTYQVEGARNAGLQNEIKDLRSQLELQTGFQINSPQVCAAGLYVIGADERLKKGLRVTLCAEVPAGTVRLKTVLIQVADCDTAAHYASGRLTDTYEITDGRTHLEFKFKPRVEYETQYRLIRFVAIDGNNNRTFFPLTEQLFSDPVPAALLFTTAPMFGVPSSPSASLVTLNRLDPVTVDVYDVELERVVFAPLNVDTGLAQSWGASGVDQVQAILTLDGTLIDPHPHILSDTELTQIADGVGGRPLSVPANRGFVTIRNEGLTPARIYTWVKNICYVNGERKVSTGPPVQINAGNFSTDLTTLTGVSLVITQTDPNTSKDAAVDLLFTQPATPVGLRWVRLRRKVQGAADSTYVTVVTKKGGVQADTFNTPGAKIFRLIESLKFKPTVTYTLECTIDARGGTQKIFTQDVGAGVSPDLPNDTTAPVLPDAPKFFFVRGKLHCKLPMVNATNIISTKLVELNISDFAATHSLNLDSLDNPSVSAGVVFYNVTDRGTVVNIPISLKRLRRIFGDVQLLCQFRLTNSIGQTTSSASAPLATLSGQVDYAPNPSDNELWNGDFTNDDGTTSTTLGNWQQYRITTGGLVGVGTGSTRGRWDQANHLAFWRQNDSGTNKAYFVQDLFTNIVRGDFKSWSFFLSSNTSLTANFDLLLASLFDLTDTWDINANLHTVNSHNGLGIATQELKVNAEVGINGDVRTVSSITNDQSFEVTPNLSGTATAQTVHAAVPQSDIVSLGNQSFTATPLYVEVMAQIRADAFTVKDTFLCFRTSTTINTAGPYLQIGRVMQAPGKTPAGFVRKNLKERNTNSSGISAGNPIASEPFSVVPTGGIGGQQQFGSGGGGDVPPVGGFIVT